MKKYYIKRSDFEQVATSRDHTIHILWPFVIRHEGVMLEVTNHDADPTRTYYFFHTLNIEELVEWIENACHCCIKYLDESAVDIGKL